MKLIDMSEQSEFPPGLRLTLNEAQMQALGLELPPAGTQLHIEAMATVTRSSTEDPDADGDVDFVTVELQLTALGAEGIQQPEKAGAMRQRKSRILYGSKDAKVGERDVGGTPEKGEFGAFNRRYGS